MIEDYDFLTKKEFTSLTDKEKWQYVKHLVKTVKSLDIMADKNCSECEKELITDKDVNVDLFFEDWRDCSEHCDECGKEEQIYICNLQMNIINHIINEIGAVRKRLNSIAELIFKKDKAGTKLLKKLDKKLEKEKQQKKTSGDMFS